MLVLNCRQNVDIFLCRLYFVIQCTFLSVAYRIISFGYTEPSMETLSIAFYILIFSIYFVYEWFVILIAFVLFVFFMLLIRSTQVLLASICFAHVLLFAWNALWNTKKLLAIKTNTFFFMNDWKNLVTVGYGAAIIWDQLLYEIWYLALKYYFLKMLFLKILFFNRSNDFFCKHKSLFIDFIPWM